MVFKRLVVKSIIDWKSIDLKFVKNPKRMKQLAEITLKEIESYVPYRTGRTTKSGKAHYGYLTYRTPYVGYIYKGRHMKFNRKYHANATYEWIPKGYKARKSQIAKRAQKEIFGR